MKKTLVALAVLAAAGSAQAIELYNQDGVTVNLAGDIEVVYKQGIGVDEEMKQEIQDADFGFDVRYAVNDDLQFGGYWEFDGSADNGLSDNAAKAGNAYVALYSQTAGSIKFGRLDSVLDDAGIGADYQFGLSAFFSNNSPFGADESIRYDIDKGTFYGALAYKQDKNQNSGLGQNGNMIDGKIGARVADFDATVFFGDSKFDGPLIQNGEETLLAGELRYGGFENLNLEIAYYRLENQDDGAEKMKYDIVALAADYTYNKFIFAGGLEFASFDEAQANTGAGQFENYDKQTGWFVNAGYLIAPGATIYAEVGGNDGYSTGNNGFDAKNDVGFAIGAKAEF